MKIQIADNRITENVAVSPENVVVSLSHAVPQTLQIENPDGSISEQTLNVMQSAGNTTLKDSDAALEDLKAQLNQAMQTVEELTAQITKQTDERNQIESLVTDAVATMTPIQKVDAINKKPI